MKIQKPCYYDIRERFGLSAQMVVSAIGKVAESYKIDTFKETGAVVYDDRILFFKRLEYASILTLEGRIEVPMIISKYHQGVIQGNRVRGQADPILQDGVFYLLLVVDLLDKSLMDADGVLGVDLGVKNIASDSMGGNFSGDQLNGIRHRVNIILGHSISFVSSFSTKHREQAFLYSWLIQETQVAPSLNVDS